MSRSEGRIGRSAAWLTAAQLAPVAVNIALTPFVIGRLGETRYGLWLVASGVAMFFGQVDGGVYRTALRYFSGFAARRDVEGARNLVVSLVLPVLALQLLTLAPLLVVDRRVAAFFSTPPDLLDETTHLLRVVTLVVAVALLRGILVALLHSHMRFALTAGATLLSYVGYAVTMFLTLRAGAGLDGVALAYVVQTAVATLVIVPSALRLVPLRGARLVGADEARDFARTAWRVQASGLLTVFSTQGLLLLVGRVRPTEVAAFGPGATFAQNLRTLPANALGPVQARLGAVVASEPAPVAASVTHGIQAMWVRVVVGLAAVAVPAAYLGINAWLPIEGSLPGEVAALLVVAHLVALLPQVQLQWAVASGHAGVEARATAVSVSLMILLSAAVVPVVGSVGVGLAALVANAVGLWRVHSLIHRAGGRLRSPLRDVPVLAAVTALVVTAAVEAGLRLVASGVPLLESGPLALLLAGAGTLPGLLLYLWMTGLLRRGLEAWRARRAHADDIEPAAAALAGTTDRHPPATQ
ncbi:hypothetical protein [Arthrobacter sp. NEB 688]|uniref:hypothetical protein n=1 Tax=Arthrobacter sp. NEB 688 TaxID=904039 RepID=UPI001565D9B3|nr:hypothetical protein [Arthrobacter sp. NEB 688]QKE85307.1 hypothetical protein HL663_16080 [Arthrobacter sp. NEB 688]